MARQGIRRQLGLENAHPVLGRSERVEPHPSAVVVAQAMMKPEQALAQMRPWLRPGGIMVLPATADALPPKVEEPLCVERRRYRVPLSQLDRQLWIVRPSPS